LIGIDISATAIKLVEAAVDIVLKVMLSSLFRKITSFVDKNINDIEAADEAVDRALKKSGGKTKFAAIAGTAVIIKVINCQRICPMLKWRVRFRLKPISTSPSHWMKLL